MKFLITLFSLLSASVITYSQTIDFNKKYQSCTQDPHCAPFFYKPVYCDSPYTGSIVFTNLFGAPNYINWKKSTTNFGGRTTARALHFRSSYSFPTINYADGLALQKTFTKNKVYNISIVASSLRGESYPGYVSGLRVSLDKVDGANINGGADSCGIGQYNQLPDSYYFSDITPPLIDTNVTFNEALFTTSYQTAAPDNYNYLGLRAIPHSGVPQADLMIHKIVAQELNFKFKQSVTTLYCDVPVTDSFILLNPDKIFGVSEYHWDLGPQPNGWYQGGTQAPQFITTVDSFLVLQWNGNRAPSKVKVVPYIGSTALAYSYQDAITYSNDLPPSAVIVGDTNIITTSPANMTYTLSNVPSNANIVWDLTPSNLGTFASSGLTANFLPNTEEAGDAILKATVTNSCGISKIYQLSLHLRNSCDIYPLNYPANLIGTPTSSPGMTVLSWDAVPYVGSYTVDYMASDGSNHEIFDVTSTTTNYYGPANVSGSFRVRSNCKSGKKSSNWSPWKTFSTTPCILPSATNLVAVNACGSSGYLCGYIQYSWTPVSGATAYEVESIVFNPSQGIINPSVIFQCSSSSIYNMGYTPPLNGTGWRVKFRVRSRCSDNTWTNFSDWSANYALN